MILKTHFLVLAGIFAVIIFSCSPSPKTAAEIGVDSVNTHQYVAPVLIGKDNNPVVQIRIDVQETAQPLTLNGLSISTLGTSDLNDVQAVRVFKSDSAGSFITESQFGSTKELADKMDFEGNLTLTPGTNYFWISCQLSPTANLLNKVQLTCSSVSIDGNELKPLAKSSANPKRMGHALRKHNDDGVDTYRIPGLATTNEGTLIGVYDIRRNSSVDLQEDVDVGMSRSTDDGQTWEPMKVIMDMGEWGGKLQEENGIGDPSVLIDRQTNTIWVAAVWAHGHPGKRNWHESKPGLEPMTTSQFVLVKSEDDGLTWSDPINITKQIKDSKWHLLLQGPGKGITLGDGTLVFPAQFKDENQVPHSTLIYSKDRGETWKIGSGLRAETTEAQIVQLDNGDVMINARNNEARNQKGIGRVVATTSDLGQTWKEHPSTVVALEESTCMASLVNEEFEKHGKLLLFSNPNTHSGRFNMTIKISKDEGLTWPERDWLLLDEGRGRGYSCMTKIDQETIGILYEGSQADLVFEKVEISEILNQ